MALYVLALIVFLGIFFLLYCFWNFARELKPRSTRVFAPSRWSTWGSVHPIPMARLRRQNAFKSRAKAVDLPDRDYPRPTRVSQKQHEHVSEINRRAVHWTQ
jgi:hypothetical protein